MVFHQRVHYDINHYHVCGMHTQLYHSGVAVSSSKQETSLFLGNFGISIYSTISCFSSEYFNSDLVFFRKHLVCSSSCSDSTDDISKYCTVVMSETENLFKWDKGFTQNLTWTVFKWMLLCVKQTLVNLYRFAVIIAKRLVVLLFSGHGVHMQLLSNVVIMTYLWCSHRNQDCCQSSLC